MTHICKKCLLADIDPDGIYKEISELIGAIPTEKKADEKEYRRRLSICGKCDQLGAGTCGKCGCFVELRAAKKDMRCPHERRYW